MNQRVAMVQRVANSRKLVLELRQWFPGLLRLKDDNDLDAMLTDFELLGEIEGGVLGTSPTSEYEYDGLLHLELSLKYADHLLKNNDFRVLNPKTGRPQVKYLEKFLTENLEKTDLFNDNVKYEAGYWPEDDFMYKFDLKIKKVIPKKDSILVVIYLKFYVSGEIDPQDWDYWARQEYLSSY